MKMISKERKLFKAAARNVICNKDIIGGNDLILDGFRKV